MDQDQFNQMLQVAIAQGFGGGTFVLKYNGEEINSLLDYVKSIMPTSAEKTGVIDNA